ncbi:hypothetical protein O181_008002 [Austropuccinia psidii MF-1]|uniref:Uncharacterized protein n=1 Tax=Austropuccinia psidii MF-1 TaxID=1389203 RepID=A0A9Q3BNW7_9BASI|nr:hypothetical protein [Austropuccinia psidii MF-1]
MHQETIRFRIYATGLTTQLLRIQTVTGSIGTEQQPTVSALVSLIGSQTENSRKTSVRPGCPLRQRSSHRCSVILLRPAGTSTTTGFRGQWAAIG